MKTTLPRFAVLQRCLIIAVLLLLSGCALAGGCASDLPDVQNSQHYRDALQRWERSMADERVGAQFESLECRSTSRRFL